MSDVDPPPGTVRCPGTVQKPCGNPIPAVPGITRCTVCGAWLTVLPPAPRG